DPAGFACFGCHSPHGNSARIMTTFANPGRAFVGPGQQGRPTTAQVNNPASGVFYPIKAGFGNGDQDGSLESTAHGSAVNEWGVDVDYGNFVWFAPNPTGGNPVLRYRPIWPSGRFLLLKNPHGDVQETKTDTQVADFGVTATDGVNKFAINWVEPLGPADGTYGGFQDNDNDNAFPFAPASGSSPTGTGGFLSAFEFCTDCHDGTAGASTQRAEVWKPNASDSTTGTYVTAYAHDVQPRH
ncbi:MAG: hypothetical protein Q8M55_06520, partial [Actinomycetota bacterium]|nr:hypothetical protein [Actinomycetota bacterium]